MSAQVISSGSSDAELVDAGRSLPDVALGSLHYGDYWLQGGNIALHRDGSSGVGPVHHGGGLGPDHISPPNVADPGATEAGIYTSACSTSLSAATNMHVSCVTGSRIPSTFAVTSCAG